MRKFLCFTAAALLWSSCSGRKEENPPPPRLKRAVETLYNKPPCASTIPGHWSPSWPVPSSAKKGEFKLMYYPVARKGRGLELSAPLGNAAFTADGTPVSCERAQGPETTLSGPLQSATAAKLDGEGMRERSNRLYELTEEVGAIYWAGKAPSAEEALLLGEYVELFKDMAEPPLLPYYFGLEPAFWDWISPYHAPPKPGSQPS